MVVLNHSLQKCKNDVAKKPTGNRCCTGPVHVRTEFRFEAHLDPALQLRHPVREVQQLIMKQFVVLLAFVSPLALAVVETSYGNRGGALDGGIGVPAAPLSVAQKATAPHCVTTSDTVTSQQIILPALKSCIDTKTFEWYSHWF